MMKENPAWAKALKGCPDPARAARRGEQLAAADPEYFAAVSPEQARVLAALFSGSMTMSELLLAHPEWLPVVEADRLRNPRRLEGLRREVARWLQPLIEAGDYAAVLKRIRDFKQREMLRVAARDLARLGRVEQITEEISNIADITLHVVYRACLEQLIKRHGLPYTREHTGKWQPASFSVLGMGKHGGQELNYSSDIDVLFVYSAEGDVLKSPPEASRKPSRTISNHQFFTKLAENIIAECTRMTAEGFLFRIDLRLRPEGKSGPLARSLASYESYYAQWGQTWERMMLIKARCVAGDAGLGAEFLEMIQSFRYPRSISEAIPREVAEMKQRIENEVVRSGEIERNVKLGRGGIREIEFVTQTLQVLHAGKLPFLQNSRTLAALEKMREYKLLEPDETLQLREAYCFLRDIEHRLQMEDNRQTHTLPADKKARERVAALMGFPSLAKFETRLREHTGGVRRIYDRIVRIEKREGEELPRDFQESADEWKAVLALHSFRDPERCLQLAREFVEGPGFGHVSSRTTHIALQLLARFLAMCSKKDGSAPPNPFLSDPDRVLARLDSFVSAYGARSMLYEAWAGNPPLFTLLLLLFDRSEFLAELAIRVPDLVDEIEQSGQLRRKKTAPQILQDLRCGIQDEDQHRWLRRYFQAEQMRVGLRDILDLADPEQTQAEITALADAFIEYGLEVIMRRHQLREPPFAIFGLGKLGGGELIYASDLDILFTAPDSAELPRLQKLAAEFMDLLSRRTEDGATFETDARLRPDGEKGLLVNTLGAFEEYYRKRALLWEIQSISRARFIAGDAAAGEQFATAAQRLSNFSAGNPGTAAWSEDWKGEIHKMRMRIEKERTPPGKAELAIKTGAGGLMDAEFAAQALCLANGWHEPNTLRALARAGTEQPPHRAAAETLSAAYRWLMQVERILRRWSFAAESLLPDDPAPLYRVAVRCGFKTSAAFMAAVAARRQEMRAAYDSIFGKAAPPERGQPVRKNTSRTKPQRA